MSEAEVPQIGDDAIMSDATDVSSITEALPETLGLSDASVLWEKTRNSDDNLPASNVTEASDKPEANSTENGTINMPEFTDLPESADALTEDFTESSYLPAETNIAANLPVDLPATGDVAGTESISKEDVELEERLEESFESQDPEGPEPDDQEPNGLEPDVQEPDGLEPEVQEPESLEPESLEPVSQEPESLEPESLEPESLEREGQEPVGLEPESLESNAPEPDGLEPESQEPEGQEEWLSEGVLTDDDGIPATQATESQDSQHLPMPLKEHTPPTHTEQNIEDALNDLQGGSLQEGFPDGLDAFLIRKPEVKTEATTKSGNGNRENDGNDTDDLLRMLSEDNNKKKRLTKTVKDVRNAIKAETPSSDDDEYQVSASKKVKLTKCLPSKVQIKTEPVADISEKGAKKILNSKQPKPEERVKYQETLVRTVQVMQRTRRDGLATSTPLKNTTRSLLKPAPPPANSVQVKREPNPYTYSRYSPHPVLRPTPRKELAKPAPAVIKQEVIKEVKRESDPVMHDEEYLDEEQLDMDEDELEAEYGGMDNHTNKSHRRGGDGAENGMERGGDRVERGADESDIDSHSEDGSLYDELPSSDSEEVEDWFQVDIRAERASDYLPLLGSKAKEILLEEKRRVAARLANLKQSMTALTDSGKAQAEQVRTATLSLAELDDMLKAS